ncbi:hypothetical protein ABN584_19050 [Gloeocapsa sp. BRSZ]|nr:hypothetical protein [Gloeocapsopsis sp. IPPAS B-1203]
MAHEHCVGKRIPVQFRFESVRVDAFSTSSRRSPRSLVNPSCQI